MIEWIKWQMAPKEMQELEDWRIQWDRHRRWFAEFDVAATALDHLKAEVEGAPVTNIHTARDSFRALKENLRLREENRAHAEFMDRKLSMLRTAAQQALEAFRFIELFIGVYDGVTLDKSRAEASRRAAITTLEAALKGTTP